VRPLPVVQPPPPYAEWLADMTRVRQRSAHPAAVAASHLEGSLGSAQPRAAVTDRLGEPVDAGLAKDARDLELPPWNKGRYGTAVGRAIHGVLQTVELATGRGLADAVAAQVLAEGVAQHADIVAALARAALDSRVVQRAVAGPYWRETYVGTVVGERVLEGFIDLVYREDDGLVIVDYKTDTVPIAALEQRVAFYRPQLAAYAAALEAATDERVARCVLLFLAPTGAVERTVDDIDTAVAHVREVVRSE
jgi:ATP-dependent helicase/nuclease subunit A